MNLFIEFSQQIAGIALPDRFTFPFYYTPHPLAVIASEELMDFLEKQQDLDHNFGLDPESDGLAIGKMFGVLVVQKSDGAIGYLRAFSGKLANSNKHDGFVPPVYDMLVDDGFFKKEEEVLNEINKKIEILEADQKYIDAKDKLKEVIAKAESEIAVGKKRVKEGKNARKAIRKEAKLSMTPQNYIDLEEKLKNESIKSNYILRDEIKYWSKLRNDVQDKFDVFQDRIDQLKQDRKTRSAALQKRLFRNYTFKNEGGKDKSLLEIFNDSFTKRPPAGAGECAAPKLLQYAFLNHLKPICLAEFWWGKSPSAEVRKNKTFYPACRGKCEPILGHMLSETLMDKNPLLDNPAKGKTIEILHEDDFLLVINKPSEFLSVPGKNIKDSVQKRMKAKFPDATGPLIVHRLDMSTSGIMLIAKDSRTYKHIQRQFLKRTVKKRYVALLNGIVKEKNGRISLPLRVDLNDRPRQLVCYEHGKSAITTWERIEIKQGKTRVYFYPETGRTHQLRVHAAHSDGLKQAIVGDDLYGEKGDRLHLHAESITFEHPETKEVLTFTCPPPF